MVAGSQTVSVHLYIISYSFHSVINNTALSFISLWPKNWSWRLVLVGKTRRCARLCFYLRVPSRWRHRWASIPRGGFSDFHRIAHIFYLFIWHIRHTRRRDEAVCFLVSVNEYAQVHGQVLSIWSAIGGVYRLWTPGFGPWQKLFIKHRSYLLRGHDIFLFRAGGGAFIVMPSLLRA